MRMFWVWVFFVRGLGTTESPEKNDWQKKSCTQWATHHQKGLKGGREGQENHWRGQAKTYVGSEDGGWPRTGRKDTQQRKINELSKGHDEGFGNKKNLRATTAKITQQQSSSKCGIPVPTGRTKDD